MYVILTSKDGKFRTEPGDGVQPCEAYDYLFYGEKKARFVIAELLRNVKIRVIDEAEPPLLNEVPCKFFAKFPSVEEARAGLRQLTTFGTMRTRLERVA